MKKTIKGITYDTGSAKQLVWDAAKGEDRSLYQTFNGNFFLFLRHPLVDGKRLPKGIDATEVLPDLFNSRESKEFESARKRLEWKETIRPLTRRQALAWCIKYQLPRTFHKDLARFLK
jgi:hypothetical protein